jgi:hypothetical protein
VKDVESARDESSLQHSLRAPRSLPTPRCVPLVHSPPNPLDKTTVSSPSSNPRSPALHTPVLPPLQQVGAAPATSRPRNLLDMVPTRMRETPDVSSPLMLANST